MIINSYRFKKVVTNNLEINIISPTEGAEVTETDVLQSEVNATTIRIVFPTEGAEVTETDVLQSEIE